MSSPMRMLMAIAFLLVSPQLFGQALAADAIDQGRTQFGVVNYIVLFTYLGFLVWMGFFFSRKGKTSKDYFLGGGRVPWWAAGLSIYATQLSAITFISMPAVPYALDWVTYPGKFVMFLTAPIVIAFFLPFYRRLKVTTAYEYLEKRYGISIRLYGATSFVVMQLVRMGIVVFLPAMTLSVITGIDIYFSIFMMGILAILYTTLGGIEAVIWTDVLQVVILLGGLIVSFIFISLSIDDWSTVGAALSEHQKLKMFNWEFSFTTLATWSILLGNFMLHLAPYTTDQAVIQRYLTTKDEKAAAKSIWTNCLISLPAGICFFLMGTFLWIYFLNNPDPKVAAMPNDQVFPYFIFSRLPIGISGLVIAGIFSASMSSLDSSMHSIATVVTTDYYGRFKKDITDRQRLVMARWITVVVGVLGTAAACALAAFPIQSLLFFFQGALGLISSSLVGIFLLGIFTQRANARGVLCGAIVCVTVLACVRAFTPIHFFIYPLIGVPICVIVGYLVSILWKMNPKELGGLTYKTLEH